MSDEESSSRQKLQEYLVEYLRKGKQFFKSKYIARDLGMTPKEVGANLSILSEESDVLDIKRWGYSKSTTWRISLKSGA